MEERGSETFENGYVERFEVLRSMSIGLCNNLSRQMENAGRHLDLLQDELEMGNAGKTALRYLNENRQATQRISNLLAKFMQTLPEPGFLETVALQPLVRGVLGQYDRLTGRQAGPDCQVPDDLNVRCNVFQLQQLLFDLCVFLDERPPDEMARTWRFEAAVREFDAGEVEFMRLACAPGRYVVLTLSGETTPADWADTVSLGVVADDEVSWPHPLMRTLSWLGFIQGMGGELLTGRKTPGRSLRLLLPEGERHVSPSPQGASKSGGTILLVDDEEMVWEVISAMLGDLGYDVLLASSGREAISIYESNPGQIDLVMLDMLMPELSGRETFFRLQKIDPDVKVLMTSGYVSDKDIQDVLRAGACGFLQKPYRMRELADCIAEILTR